MSEQQKKQNFLQGTALLAMATAIVKVIGALYKIPLNAIIGEQGFGYFNTAYEIYNVLLMISTAGLPVAMSRMISQASSLRHYNQVRRVYATARVIRCWSFRLHCCRLFSNFALIANYLIVYILNIVRQYFTKNRPGISRRINVDCYFLMMVVVFCSILIIVIAHGFVSLFLFLF